MTVSEYNSCVDAFADAVYRFVLKTIGDSDSANDVVQDTFERLWVKRQGVNYAKVKSYLFTTAYHAAIDTIRRSKRSTPLSESASYTESTQGNQYSDLQEVLHSAIEQLPPVQRSVVLLRDYEGYSYEEIEEITGLNQSQVKVYIYRARVWLRQHIGSVEALI